MVATRDIERMLPIDNADTTNISNLKVVPPVTEIDFPNPSPEFGMETRDEQVLSRSSRSDRRPKRDDGSFAAAISRTDKNGDGSTTLPRTVNHQGRGENASSLSNLKTRHTSGSNRRRERSQTCENLSKINPDCATGAFDYTPIEPNAGCNDESSGASNFPCQASASSKLLGTTTSSTTVPVNIVTKKSPKKMKGISPRNIVSPKKMTTNDTDARATAVEPTIIGNAKVFSRSLIPPKVYQSSATGLWISTVNTASNSSDDMKAFSFRTEQEARASAYANAPPMMIPFDTCSQCMLCDVKFTLLRRRKSCRNCGICICSNYSCSTKWRAKMVPETYNVKK